MCLNGIEYDIICVESIRLDAILGKYLLNHLELMLCSMNLNGIQSNIGIW